MKEKNFAKAVKKIWDYYDATTGHKETQWMSRATSS